MRCYYCDLLFHRRFVCAYVFFYVILLLHVIFSLFYLASFWRNKG